MNEAELLFTHVLDCDRLSLYTAGKRRVPKETAGLISSILKKRACGQPLQYILGKADFMGWEFKVNPAVFIPRPETERLAETAIKYARGLTGLEHSLLEIGTGSGCIAVSLAGALPDFNVTATDISREALSAAYENSGRYVLNRKINFIQSDLFSSPILKGRRFSICVFNPPYISTCDIENLQPEIRYEPRGALDGGSDGLVFYRRLSKEAHKFIDQDGFLLLEMGAGQSRNIRNIFAGRGVWKCVEVVKDYLNIERVVVFQKAGENG